MILKFIFLLNIGATKEPNTIIFEQKNSELFIIEEQAQINANFTFTLIEPENKNKFCDIEQSRSLKTHFNNIIKDILSGQLKNSTFRKKRQILTIVSAIAGFEFGHIFFSEKNHYSIAKIESDFHEKLQNLECRMINKLGRLEEGEIENNIRIEVLNLRTELENLSKDLKSNSKTRITHEIFSKICEKHSFTPTICKIYSETITGDLSDLNILNTDKGLYVLFTLKTKIPRRFKRIMVDEIFQLNLPIFNNKKKIWEKRPDLNFFVDTNTGNQYFNQMCFKSEKLTICSPYTSEENINVRQLQLKRDQCYFSKHKNHIIIVKAPHIAGNFTYLSDQTIVKSSPLSNQNILPLNKTSKIHVNCGTQSLDFYADENFTDKIQFNVTFLDFETEANNHFTIFQNKPELSSVTLVFVVIFCSVLFLTAGITMLFKRFPTIRITKCIKKSNKKIKDRNTLSDIASIDSVFSFTTVPNTHHRSLPISLSNPNLNFNNRATRGRACFARPCRNRQNTRTPSTFSVYHE